MNLAPTIGIKIALNGEDRSCRKVLYNCIKNVPCILPKNETVNRSIESK